MELRQRCCFTKLGEMQTNQVLFAMLDSVVHALQNTEQLLMQNLQRQKKCKSAMHQQCSAMVSGSEAQ